ncbi:MAG TPA: FAD-binding protein, partial [Myxococcota bacterium]|nr:FAD-binding protein [Myxococcota bacterium]
WLDLRHLGERHLRTKLREVWDICRDFNGLDPSKAPIPVRPIQHYSMGGIRVNKDGEAYGMRGLFAVGEAACWDMHGFNRLGGNSLAETVVAGRVVGRRVAERTAEVGLDVETRVAHEFGIETAKRLQAWLDRPASGDGTVYQVRDAVGEILNRKVGVFRSGDELESAVAELESELARIARVGLRSRGPGLNPELTAAFRIEGMTRLALVTAIGALERTESRGAHSRTDHPARDDSRWLSRTLVRWPLGSERPAFRYEPVGLLDLPPGDRGYGKSAQKPMDRSLETYNADAPAAMRREGSLPTREPMGSRMRWGHWQGYEDRPMRPERNE